MNKILIIGSDGQVGSEIKKQKNNNNFIFLSRAELDVSDALKLEFLINNIKPDLIVNCVAYTNVRNAKNDTNCISVNVDYVKHLVDICFLNDIFLIHFSTDYVYNGNKATPYIEDDQTDPINFYGQSKLQGDKIIIKKLKKYLIIRASWIFSGTNNCFLTKIYNQMKKSKTIQVDNISLGNPLYVGDLVSIILLIISKYEKGGISSCDTGVYNYCSQPETTWFNFANEFCKYLYEHGYIEGPMKIIKNNEPDKTLLRPQNSRLDIKKIKKLLNINDTFWKDSFGSVVNNLQKNKI